MVRRIAIFTCNSPHLGGVERVMTTLANELVKRGHQVDFLSQYLTELDLRLHPPVRPIQLKPFRRNCVRQLLNYVVREKPCAVLTHGHGPNRTAIITKLFYPRFRSVVYQANPISVVTNEESHRGWVRSKLLPSYLDLLSRADTVICLNNDMAEDFRSYVPGAEIQVQHSPHDLEQVIRSSKEPVDHPWLTPNRDILVAVTVTRLHPQKDLPTMLRAAAEVSKSRPIRLIVVGDGDELLNLRLLATKLNISSIVDFVGFEDNPHPYVANADLFLLSSVYEGMPGALMHALACGTSVVGTDCLSGPRDILDGGRYGHLVPVGDHLAMSKAITDTLDDPMNPDKLRRSILKRYDMKSSIDAYERILGLA